MKNDEQVIVEVFRDHLEGCVKHFANRILSKVPQRTRNAAVFRQPMVDFLGVSHGTVQRMLYGLGSLPSGENRLKLMFYLDLHGYKVIELEHMRAANILGKFAELIGYSILSASDAAGLVGFKSQHGDSDASNLYLVLRGGAGISKDRVEKMWTIWKAHRSELERKKKEAFEKFRLKLDPVAVSTLTQVPPPAVIINASVLTTRPSQSYQPVLNIMEGLLGILKQNPFEGISNEELGIIRTVHGVNILDLSMRIKMFGAKLIESEKDGVKNGQ